MGDGEWDPVGLGEGSRAGDRTDSSSCKVLPALLCGGEVGYGGGGFTRPPSSVRRVNLDNETWPKLAGRLAESGLVTAVGVVVALLLLLLFCSPSPEREKGVPVPPKFISDGS